MSAAAARARLAEIRAEVADLLAEIDAAAPPVQPVAVRDHRDGQTVMRFWYEGDLLSVHTCVGPDSDTVFVSGRWDTMQFWPDWAAVAPDEARRLGLALLAAAGDTANELVRVRTQRPTLAPQAPRA